MVCQDAVGCSDKCPERNIKEQRNDSVQANEFRSRYEMAVTGRFSITIAKNVEKYTGSVLLLTTTLTDIGHIYILNDILRCSIYFHIRETMLHDLVSSGLKEFTFVVKFRCKITLSFGRSRTLLTNFALIMIC